MSALEARRLAPALPSAGLRGALLSWDGQLEDDARLVIAIARTAAAHGARILTYAAVTGLREDGVEAVDARTGAAFTVRARQTVVAAGVWTGALTDAVRAAAPAAARMCWCGPTGSAIRARRSTCRCPANAGAGCSPSRDRTAWSRSASPTSRLPASRPTSRARTRPRRSSCSHNASAALDVPLGPTTSPAATPACARWRPERSDAETADLSRRHTIVTDPASGALAIVGGKLTTYRRMAQDVVDRVTDRPVPHGPTAARRRRRTGGAANGRRAGTARAPLRHRGAGGGGARRRPPGAARAVRPGRARVRGGAAVGAAPRARGHGRRPRRPAGAGWARAGVAGRCGGRR